MTNGPDMDTGAAAEKDTTTSTSSDPTGAPRHTPEHAELLPVAAALIRRVDPATVPVYGSPAFLALPSTSRVFVAAVVRAAECWRLHHTPQAVAGRLDEEARVVARRLRLASYDVADAYRERRANPPGPWAADATVPAGFYPPAVTS